MIRIFTLTLSLLALPCGALAKTSQGYVLPLRQAPKKVHAKGATVQFLADPKIHGNKQLFMSVLTLPPSGKVPEHRDPTEEYLYVLEGSGTLWIDDKEFLVKPESVIYMPAGAKVRFQGSDKPVRVLQVFAPSGPEKKYDSWLSSTK